MLTFISGWRTPERDKAILNHRDPSRRGLFFVDNQSSLPYFLHHIPVIELWRHGRAEFSIDEACETLIRLNHDTDHELLARALTHALLHYGDSQIIVTYEAAEKIYRLFPALRQADALLAADERLDAPSGDRVIFTRGGSFRWRDHILEAQTALLTEEETLDAGIVPDPDEAGAAFDQYVDYTSR
jgi:hypothetical protein